MGDNPDQQEDGYCSIDRLPESILIHILSFLPVREACRTSLVSRIWRNLWKAIPRLSFDGCSNILTIYDALLRRDGSSIRSFRAEIAYTGYEDHVIDQLIRLVVHHGVKYFNMAFPNSGGDRCENFPLFFFTGASLEELILSYCKLDICGPLRMNSLRSLTLGAVQLDDATINIMLSGCPRLENLNICQCPFNAQDVSVVDSRGQLKYLGLAFWDRPAEIRIQVHAVNLSTIAIVGDLRSIDVHLKNHPSLTYAALHFFTGYASDFYCRAKLMRLLGYLSNVEVITLRDWRVLQMMAYEKKGMLAGVCFKTKHLGLWTSQDLWLEIPVIAQLLSRFPNLESLTIEQDQSTNFQYHSAEAEYWMNQYDSFAGVLGHVKDITLKEFSLIRTDIEEDMDLDSEFIDLEEDMDLDRKRIEVEEDLELVKNLLENATKLERITIFLPKDQYHSEREKSSDIAALSRIIEGFPRASSDAEILLL